MGIDIYVGSLTRYYQRRWRTSVQQYGLDHDIQVNIVRADSVNEEIPDSELASIGQVVSHWQQSFTDSIGAGTFWDDNPDSPYATNKPGWKGLGGINLLAAYAVRPDLDPTKSKKRFGRKPVLDNARTYDESLAYQATRSDFGDFPSLLGQTIWWLPVAPAPTLFTAPRPDRGTQTMSNLDQLHRELDLLASIYGVSAKRAAQARLEGPGSCDDPYRNGVFGIAALLPMAEWALANSKPLIVDF